MALSCLKPATDFLLQKSKNSKFLIYGPTYSMKHSCLPFTIYPSWLSHLLHNSAPGKWSSFWLLKMTSLLASFFAPTVASPCSPQFKCHLKTDLTTLILFYFAQWYVLHNINYSTLFHTNLCVYCIFPYTKYSYIH